MDPSPKELIAPLASLIVCLSTGLIGAAIGCAIGFFGVYYLCMFIDSLLYPDGNPTGGGLMAVGWLICFATVPVGILVGGYIGFFAVYNPRKIKEKIKKF